MGPRSSPVDSDLAQSRWHELEDVLDELAQASKSAATAAEFYHLLLARIVPALDAAGGAIWTAGAEGERRLEAQLNLAAPGHALSRDLLLQHQFRVEDVLRTREPRAIAPEEHLVAKDNTAASPWLVFHPFRAGELPGVIEVIGRPDMTAVAARECLHILSAVVELVEDFHSHRELGQLRASAAVWRQYDQFARRVHASLDVRETAFLIANEAYRLTGCDRASVLVRQGAKYRAAATSGVDTLDRRARFVRLLENLAGRSAASGEPVWYHDGSSELAKEIGGPLDAYLDESHARQLAVVPLFEARREGDRRARRPIGVLVVEQFESPRPPQELRDRVAAVSAHAEIALANALVYSRQPLARLGRWLAVARRPLETHNLPKTAVALALVAAVVAALVLVPADFNVEAKGQFQPTLRRDVFAADDGVVNELLVEHGQKVRAGQPLVVLRKPELDLEFRRLAGEIQTAEKKLAAVRAERLENAPAKADSRRDSHALAAEEEELKERLKGLADERAILEQQKRDLTVASPIDGVALSWNIQQSLEARPVERGQRLLTVGDLSGPWVLELRAADDRAGSILAAREALGPELEVSFVLASDPRQVHYGRVADVALASEFDEQAEPTLLVTVDFDKRDVAGLRPGGTANAKIHCGRRSIGYVWLADLYHFLQSLWW